MSSSEAEDRPQQDSNDDQQFFMPNINPFDTILQLLAAYGWWIIGATALVLWLYSKIRPTIEKWKIQNEDAAYHKNPDVVLKRMEAIEAARARQQKLLEETAKEFIEKEKIREEKKRQEYIDRNSGKSSGNRLGSNADYFPLCGPGTSGGYRPPKKSKCSGGGCGG